METQGNGCDSVGTELELDGSGGLTSVLHDGKITGFTFYYSTPTKPELVHLDDLVIVPYSSRIIQDLCEMFDMKRGVTERWTAKIKYHGVIKCTCHRSGIPSPSTSKGIRRRVSKKIGCLASISTRNPKTLTERKAVEDVIRHVKNIGKKECSFLCEEDMNPKFVFLTNVRMNHSGHSVQIELGVSSYMPRRNDMLQNEKML